MQAFFVVSSVSLFCSRGRAHKQHRHVRAAHHGLGIAAEHRVPYAAPAVRAHHDHVGTPLSCFVHDQVGDAAGEILVQHDLRIDTLRGSEGACFLEDLLAAFGEVFHERCGRDARFRIERERGIIDDMHDANRASQRFRKLDGFGKAPLGCVAAVDLWPDGG